MPYRIEIYVGSDNASRKINKDYLGRVRKWASNVFPEGYTLLKGEGFYNGVSEDSIIICVFSNHDLDIANQLYCLKKQMKQESVLFVKNPVDFKVV